MERAAVSRNDAARPSLASLSGPAPVRSQAERRLEIENILLEDAIELDGSACDAARPMVALPKPPERGGDARARAPSQPSA